MSFLAPWALVFGAAAAAVVAALHLLSRQRPRDEPFPTARFVPAGSARATRRVPRPTDIPLLLLRLLALLLLAAAFARPLVRSRGSKVARIVAVMAGEDRGVATAARDSARHWVREGDVRVPFAAPSLSVALAASIGAAPALAAKADSLELVVVAPATLRTDAATQALRDQWPGAIRFVNVIAAGGAAPRAAKVAWLDSTTRSAGQGSIVTWHGRSALLPGPRLALPEGEVVARWEDGAPAAVEQATADGCVRTVGVVLPATGDLALRPSARRFVQAMNAPCGEVAPLDSTATRAALASFARGPRRVSAERFLPPDRNSPWTVPLLVATLVLLLVEPLLRRASRPRAGEGA